MSFLKYLLLLFAMQCASAQAVGLNSDFDLYLDVGLFSNYKTRGISQTQNNPAVQGTAYLSHSSGFYLATFSSNVDYGHSSRTRQEIDVWGGYLWKVNDDVSINFAYLDYRYPNETKLASSEYLVEARIRQFVAAAYYSNDVGGKDATLWSYVAYDFPLSDTLNFGVHYGVADFKDPVFVSGSGRSRESYREWELKFTKEYAGLRFALSYAGTDLSDAECAGYYGYKDVCNKSLVTSVSKSF